MIITRRTAIALVAVVMTAAAGCGQTQRHSSSGSSGGAAPSAVNAGSKGYSAPVDATPVTRTVATTKANAACRLISAQRSLIKIRTAADFMLALPRLVVFQQTLVADLRQISPPASLQATWNSLERNAEVLANSVLEVEHLERSGETKAVPALLNTFGQARLRMRAIAKQAGLKDCSQY